MNHKHQSSRTVMLALGLLALQGCAMAPGMKMADHDSTQWFPGEVDTVSGQVLTITPITLELVTRQAQHDANAGVPAVPHSAPTPYRIGPTDVLYINVWNHLELSSPNTTTIGDEDANGQVVDENGILFYPFIGEIQAAGMSVAELRAVLTRELSRYIREPQLDVRVIGFHSQKIHVTGEVRQAVMLPITNTPMTVVDAVVLAGNITDEADPKRLHLARDGQVYEIDLLALHEGSATAQNPLLRHGDIINVPKLQTGEPKVFVMGEVRQPRPVEMGPARLSLAAALGEAGGVNQTTADPRGIFVIRNSATGQPQIFRLNAEYAYGLLLAERFELRDQDVVFVDTAGVSRWNRIISQLLPSVQAANSTLKR